MDGTKRKLNDDFTPHTDAHHHICTPTYSAGMYHEESALRSTQPRTGTPPTTIDPTLMPRFTPLNKFQARFQASEPSAQEREEPESSEQPRFFGRGKSRQPTPRHTTELLTDHHGNKLVHTDDGADKVYFRQRNSGSWSRALTSEEEQTHGDESISAGAVEAICRIQKANKLKDQMIDLGLRNVSTTNGMTLEENFMWYKDLLLRNVMRKIKGQLRDGAVLTLERLDDEGAGIPCSHPCCVERQRMIRPRALYVVVTQPTPSNGIATFCLLCFENLWKGHDMHQYRLPDPTVSRRPQMVKEQNSDLDLDGAVDDLAKACEIVQLDGPPFSPLSTPIPMTTTKEPASHAEVPIPYQTITKPNPTDPPNPLSTQTTLTPPPKHPNPSPTKPNQFQTPSPKTPPAANEPNPPKNSPPITNDSPTSQTSQTSTLPNGTWRHPPTRTQQIAAYFKPGTSLTEREKNAIHLWKAVSREQIVWERHLVRTERRRKAWASGGWRGILMGLKGGRDVRGVKGVRPVRGAKGKKWNMKMKLMKRF